MTRDEIARALKETLLGWRFQVLDIPADVLGVRPGYTIEIAMTPKSVDNFVSDFLDRLSE